MYFFAVSRTLGDGKTGFYFARPSWNEIVTYESELMNHESDAELVT